MVHFQSSPVRETHSVGAFHPRHRSHRHPDRQLSHCRKLSPDPPVGFHPIEAGQKPR
jgi:hypothetical protein